MDCAVKLQIPDLLNIVHGYLLDYIGVHYESSVFYFRNILSDVLLWSYPLNIKGNYKVHFHDRIIILNYCDHSGNPHTLIFNWNGNLLKTFPVELSGVASAIRVYSQNNLDCLDITSLTLESCHPSALVDYVSYDDRTRLVYTARGENIWHNGKLVGKFPDYFPWTIANEQYYVICNKNSDSGIYDYIRNRQYSVFVNPIDFIDSHTFLALEDNFLIQMDIRTYPGRQVRYIHDCRIQHELTSIQRNGDIMILNFSRLKMFLVVGKQVTMVKYTRNYQDISRY